MLVFCSFPVFALEPPQQVSLPPVLWQDRGDSRLDMVNGLVERPPTRRAF
jgi:hypothetical protein